MPLFPRRRIFYTSAIAALAIALGLGLQAQPTRAADYPAVTDDRLVNAAGDDGWLMYRRTYDSRGFAPFDQINAQNVANLKPVFTYETGLKQGHEAPPIVNGRTMFITTPMDHVIALDAVTGKVLWKYVAPIPPTALKTVCCDVVNRGVALYGDLVYISTLDDRVIALDAATGKVAWNKQLTPPGVGYAMTGAPLVVDGKVITGIAGGEYGGRGFVVALDAKTGEIAWKTFTVPAPSEKGGETWPKGAYKTGGGATWLTGSYDVETKTLLWGVGNPGPWLADLRPGTNLYTDSVIALDPADGHIKWHYQYTPHDTWDYDATNESVLADITYDGKPYKALLHADRNGNFFALDRTNGAFIYAKPFVKTTSIVSFAADGTPQSNEKNRPHMGTTIFTCPSFLGGKNWWPTAYDQSTQTIFVPTDKWCMTMKGTGTDYKAGLPFLGETFEVKPEPGSSGWGEVQAIDANTGMQKWKYETKLPWNGPLLATKGGLVFGGTVDQQFIAFDSATGKPLWTAHTSSGIIGVPTTYQVDGKQYVAVLAGYGGATPIWAGPAGKATENVPLGGKLYVFALP
jgi:alcohol dehydrogenase (cytochrome c)